MSHHISAGQDLDPHVVLGIKPPVSSTDLKAAYRERALKVHPDCNPGGDRAASERDFKTLTDAYQRLSNSQDGGGGKSACSGNYSEAFPSVFLEVLGVRKQYSERTLEHLQRALLTRLYGGRPMEDLRLTL